MFQRQVPSGKLVCKQNSTYAFSEPQTKRSRDEISTMDAHALLIFVVAPECRALYALLDAYDV